jgi:hypothetical protein
MYRFVPYAFRNLTEISKRHLFMRQMLALLPQSSNLPSTVFFSSELVRTPNTPSFYLIQYGAASLILFSGSTNFQVAMSEPRNGCGLFNK